MEVQTPSTARSLPHRQEPVTRHSSSLNLRALTSMPATRIMRVLREERLIVDFINDGGTSSTHDRNEHHPQLGPVPQ